MLSSINKCFHTSRTYVKYGRQTVKRVWRIEYGKTT